MPAIDLPYLNTADRDAAVAFAGRIATAERVLIEHPDQVTLGADMKTAAGGLSYTWPAITQLCSFLAPGVAATVSAIAGRRRTHEPNPSGAAAVFNAVVREQFHRLSMRHLLVGSDDKIIYRTANAARLPRRGSGPGEVINSLFTSGDEFGFSVFRAFGPVGRVDVSFVTAPEPTALPVVVAPAAVVRPFPMDGRLTITQAVRVGDAVMCGEAKRTARNIHRLGTWAACMNDWAVAIRPQLAGHVDRLSAVGLPGTRPDEIGPPVRRWLKAQGVASNMMTPVIRRLTTGQFPGGQTPEFADAVRFGADARWTAADLLMAIAGTVSRYAGRVTPITHLAKAGFALAVGDVPAAFV